MAKWKLWIDDTGAVGDGTNVRVTAAVSANPSVTRNEITHPVGEGDSWEVTEPGVLVAEVAAQIKAKKDSAVDARLAAALADGSQVGVLCATGDITASGSAAAGYMLLEFNALVTGAPINQSSTSVSVYDVTFKPHADNAAGTLPRFEISTSNP